MNGRNRLSKLETRSRSTLGGRQCRSDLALSVFVDANERSLCADGKLTTGSRIVINDSVLDHGSHAQPGLPAMSMAEAGVERSPFRVHRRLAID